jgi:hypothetical protein
MTAASRVPDHHRTHLLPKFHPLQQSQKACNINPPLAAALLSPRQRLLKTAALDAGVPLRDVQEAASHADPRTTMRYDRARVSLDRHATYIVATYIAGSR